MPPPLILNDEKPPERLNSRQHWEGFVVSFVFHAVALVLLASFVFSTGGDPSGRLTVTFSEETPFDRLIDEQTARIETQPKRFGKTDPKVDMKVEEPEVPSPSEVTSAAAMARESAVSSDVSALPDLLRASDADVRQALAGRNAGTRQAAVGSGEASAAGENAVERGLRWIMSKQQKDGGWSFKLDSRSANPGSEESRTAATAMALLPFLGAGYTQREGPYTDVVGKGLYFLQMRAVVTPNGANLQDGTMYGQGLATIALCEAYAMTKDPTLRDLSQQAIEYIAFAQATDGGWRYTPGRTGRHNRHRLAVDGAKKRANGAG